MFRTQLPRVEHPLHADVGHRALVTMALLVIAATVAPIDAAAQPIRSPDPLLKSVSEYVYLVNSTRRQGLAHYAVLS